MMLAEYPAAPATLACGTCGGEGAFAAQPVYDDGLHVHPCTRPGTDCPGVTMADLDPDYDELVVAHRGRLAVVTVHVPD
jgi:hypothetical protein